MAGYFPGKLRWYLVKPTFEVDLAVDRGLAQSEKSVHVLLGHFLAASRQHALEDLPVQPARLVRLEHVDEGAPQLGPRALHAPRPAGDERAEGGEVDCGRDGVDSRVTNDANQTGVRGLIIKLYCHIQCALHDELVL